MSFFFIRGDQYCEISAGLWFSCLDLAKSVGWQSTNAMLVVGPMALTDQFSSEDAQVVTDAEGYALADALYQAIAASEVVGERNALAAWKRVADFVSEGGFRIA